MIRKQYIDMLGKKDIIFEIFGCANARRAEVGPENVYDFSLGNPSVPAPPEVAAAVLEITEGTDPLSLHGYSPAGGIPQVREAIAKDLNRRYGTDVNRRCGISYEGKHIFMTCGAAAALAHAMRAVTEPGAAILAFAPCFPEYAPYAEGAGCVLKTVPADTESFQINMGAAEKMLTPDVQAVILNSPNTPSGIVCSTQTVQALADLLERKSAEYGHRIWLISDEPYRELLFSGTDSPYIASYYADTITCYSFSKSLSLPGERIGYAAVNPAAEDADLVISVMAQVSRTTGHNGAPALWQRVAARTCHLTADLSVYEKNKDILLSALREYGYHCVEPGGSFYMFPRALEEDAEAFCRRAMEMDLMLVPGDNFGCPGHFRIAYCVPTERVLASLPVFKRLAESYGV